MRAGAVGTQKASSKGSSETEVGEGRPWPCQSALTPHQCPPLCLSLGISSSFPVIFSTQMYVQMSNTETAVFLFFSTVSKPSCKAELPFDPPHQPTAHHLAAPTQVLVLPHLYSCVPRCCLENISVIGVTPTNIYAYTHVSVPKHMHTYILHSVSTY